MLINKSFFYFVLILIIGSICTFISCNKEPVFTNESDTIKIATIFHPDTFTGKNAIIESIVPNKNFGNYPIISAFSWTDTGYFNTARSLIDFNLSEIIPYTAIKSARLSLYFNGFANLNGQTGENGFTLYRISKSWKVNTVTWNNQPSYSNLDSVPVLKSTATNQSYLNIDVSNLVRDIINNPSTSFGLMLKLNTESPYALVVLGSCYNNNSSVHPKLIVYY